jgi:hypothetical protein
MDAMDAHEKLFFNVNRSWRKMSLNLECNPPPRLFETNPNRSWNSRAIHIDQSFSCASNERRGFQRKKEMGSRTGSGEQKTRKVKK